MKPQGITTYDLGHSLTLVRDENADCLENAWAVCDIDAGNVPDHDDYATWWGTMHHVGPVLDVDARLLAVLAEKVVGVEIG